MTNKEYLEIFKEAGLIRSPIVRFLEQQIQTLARLQASFLEHGDEENAEIARHTAEKAKWETIEIAEYEKANGMIKVNLGGK
ncbi:hypothetical protein [Enterococcus sp. AZ163]|uniref:hypothetical protein n=1 Tax=Enterococcus sp. AZ163 TaxID=2774638 RepID=UPI003D2B30AA